MTEKRDKRGKGRSPFVLRAVALFLLAAVFTGMAAYGALATIKQDQIIQGVSIHGISIGGRTADEAAKEIRAQVEGLKLRYALDGESVEIDPDDGGVPIAKYDIDNAVRKALNVGRSGNPVIAMYERVRTSLVGTSIDLPHTLDGRALRYALEKRLVDTVSLGKDAKFVVTVDDGGSPNVKIEPERDGAAVNYDALIRLTDNRLSALSDETITIPAKRDKPKLTKEDISPLTQAVITAVQRGPFVLAAKSETWTVSRSTFADWIVAVPADNDGAPILALDREKVKTFLESRAAGVTTQPKNAVFEEKDGKVTKFEPSEDGETVDPDASAVAIGAMAFGSDAVKTVTLPMMAVHPDVDTEKSNPYGIKEIIGIGATNFRGSPKNRRHNISVGAGSVNGTLIAPGEEFSMLKTLGTIDGTTGYLEELVIKENKTTPEYGGGLCQIGSTAFRATLDSGLPVTMRQNHSYRVPYYERDGDGNDIGPGKDATIYDPAPDYRFLNDTGHEILIWTDITGNKLTFTFWGVKDGRTASQTKSRVYNIVKPPPKKVIQTSELKIGEEKCTEHAHVGSEAVFDYSVVYADGTKKDKEFHSHYKPWQEVCLVGVDPSTLPPGVTSQELVTSPDSGAADAPPAPTPKP